MELVQPLAQALRDHVRPLDLDQDLDVVLEKVGNKRFVCLGESSHGTHEYYTWRARLTKRLIQEKGFHFVAVEGDWPDCMEINRYIKGSPSAAPNALQALQKFKRWPTWMWGNYEMQALVEWLRAHNLQQALPERRAGFYGLDVYSLLESLESVLAYLKKVDDKEATKAAENAIRCFSSVSRSHEDLGQAYGMATPLTPYSCRKEVVNVLLQLRKVAQSQGQQQPPLSLEHGRAPPQSMDPMDREETFSAHVNAKVALDAEAYYTVTMEGDGESWNIRDRHMMDTFNDLVEMYGPQSKGIIWAHNTHIGDARHTTMGSRGMWNVGQLVRQEHGPDNTVLIGLGSYEGTVLAGKNWGAKMEVMPLPKGRPGSWEEVCHRVAGEGGKVVVLLDEVRGDPLFKRRIGHRAVGVVYDPKAEKYGNYVPSVVADRYDLFIFIDRTRALHALDLAADTTELPDTYPFGV